MLANDRGESCGGVVERRIPRHAFARRAARRAQLWVARARARTRGQMQRRTLGAQTAEICRVVRITAHSGYPRSIRLDHDPAANAAITTTALMLWHGKTV